MDKKLKSNLKPPHDASAEQTARHMEQTLLDSRAKHHTGAIPKANRGDGVCPHPNLSNKGKSIPLTTAKKQLPRLGEPGGLDDPLRKGMNGSDVKWYIRFLEKGLTPVEAKQKTLERKTSPTEAESGAKRSRQSPGDKPPTKRPKQSYADVAKTTKVAVLPLQYPDAKLTIAQLNAIEKAIIDAMATEKSQHVNFEGLVYRPNMLIIGSVDNDSTCWLSRLINKIAAWEGIPLTVKVGDDIPKPHVINVFLPKCTERTTEELVNLLKVSNAGICTDEWKVLARKEQGKGILLTIGVNADSIKQIIKQNNTLRFQFTRVRVYGHKKGLAEEEKAAAAASLEQEASNRVEPEEDDVQDLPELDLTPLHLDSESGLTPDHSEDSCN